MLILSHHFRFIVVNPAVTFVISPSFVLTSPESNVLPFILILAESSFKSNPFGIISSIFTLFSVVPGTKLFTLTLYVTSSPTLYSSLSTLFCISSFGSFTTIFLDVLVLRIVPFPLIAETSTLFIISSLPIGFFYYF